MFSHKLKYTVIILSSLFLILVSSFVVFAQGNNLTDYQYQLDQYRGSYAEYQIFKNDYQTNPTLNNEQKAVLAAKRSIASRELTLAYYSLIMIDDLKASGVDYPIVNTAVSDLNTIGQFHFDQSQSAAKINTKADLTAFTTKYLASTADQKDNLSHAMVAIKIGELIQIQNNAKQAYDSLLPSLKTNQDQLNVQNGIGQIQSYSQQINDQIAALAKKTTETSTASIDQAQFFDDSSQSLMQIRSLQSRLINIIIELDTNYAHH